MTVEDQAGAATPPRDVRRSVLNRLHYWGARALYASVGRWLSASRLPFMIEHRPDFHAFGGLTDYDALRRAWTHGNRANNSGDFARFYALYQNVRKVLGEGVPGALVELGVYKGNSAAMLAALGREYGRQTILFDTFEGFDPRDLTGIDRGHKMNFTDTSLGGVKALVGEAGVTYVQGYFPASLEGVTLPDRIAVAHVDCDLHDPMKAALEHFYGRMSPGGLMILHDYASGRWPGGTKAIDDFFEGKPEALVLIPDKSGTAIARKV